jgi:formate hydrogenlyase subunit 4
MSLLTALLAQVLHAALLLVATPVLTGLMQWSAAGFTGSLPAMVRADWQDLRRLMAKRPMAIEPAAASFALLRPLAAGVTAAAALLVPSFALGMTLSPLADVITVLGLLILARALSVLLAMDAGTAAGGLAARHHVRLSLLSHTAALSAVLAIGLGAGTLMLDQIAAIRLDDSAVTVAVRGLGAVALGLVICADQPGPGLSDTATGRDLALDRLTESLRRLVWFDLVLILFAPIGVAPAEAGLTGWPLAILLWLARLGVLAGLVAGVRSGLGSLGTGWTATGLQLAGGSAALALMLSLGRGGGS